MTANANAEPTPATPEPSPSLLIFDLDDTLISSFPGYCLLNQQVAEDLGWPVPTKEDLVEYGPTWEETLARLFPGRALEPFYARFHELLDQEPYAPIPGAREALEAAREAGHRLFIVTKRTSRLLDRRLREANLPRELFDGIYPADHGPAPKPDPRCFEPIWEMTGYRPRGDGGAIYFGDRAEDALVARRAGLPFVAVLTGPESGRGFPESIDANIVLRSVGDLTKILPQLRRGLSLARSVSEP